MEIISKDEIKLLLLKNGVDGNKIDEAIEELVELIYFRYLMLGKPNDDV